MRAAALAGLLLGCATSEAPVPASAPPGGDPPAPAPVERWRSAGRVAPGEDGGLPFEGARAALSACGEARPCVAERWVREDRAGEALVLLLAGDRLGPVGQDAAWRTTWRAMSGALPACLGPPLAAPPAGDPTATRHLERQGDAWRWVLTLGGHSRCRLEGRLVLDATADRADASALACDGRPWLEGGREQALALLRADLRARAVAEWAALSPAERVEWMLVLEQDPDARLLVEELRAVP